MSIPDENKNQDNRRILPLMLTRYRFDNNWDNFLLNTCCGIPFEELFQGYLMMNMFLPDREKKPENNVEDKKLGRDEPYIQENIEINTTPGKKHECIPLLFDSAIYTGRTNILVAPGKLGKSQLSMEAAKSPYIKRPAFILREDYTGEQIENYHRIVGDKAIIVTVPDWHKTGDTIKGNQELIKQAEIYMRFTNPSYNKFRNISNQVMSRAGIRNEKKDFDEITVWQAVANLLLEDGVDFICLDNLNALTGGNAKISRTMIERILEPIVSKNVTFLLIHHTNKKGDVFGSIDIINAFDHIYHLRKMQVPLEQNINGADRLLIDETSRYTQSKQIIFERKFIDDIPIYTMLSDKPADNTPYASNEKNVADRIINILTYLDGNTILFPELFDMLGNISKGTLKNTLTELKTRGLINMTDGKTWHSITSLM
jgi:hypothetical protein